MALTARHDCSMVIVWFGRPKWDRENCKKTEFSRPGQNLPKYRSQPRSIWQVGRQKGRISIGIRIGESPGHESTMNRMERETEDGKLGEVVDELLSKMARGEPVDVERYAAEHPDVADVLRHAIPALRAVAHSSSSGLGTRVESGGPLSGDGEMPVSPNRSLGDFKIHRELGRGGMGVVYEAEQISLGRKVALKVLPFAGMVRGNALQRFQNEARAAATLDHPNIVSVYSVGEERGVHYYAMQLVRGQSLAEVIAQLTAIQDGGRARTGGSLSEAMSAVKGQAPASATEPTEELPSQNAEQSIQSTRGDASAVARTIRSSGDDRDFYRSIAVLAVQAADALQHAHDSGVIHRDIKPGNLMLDAEGNVYVADFGLARLEADAGVTMTGDVVGTLRYMSPEQALAKRAVVDHRTDVYSLGATLYELLTLRPVFSGSDRQEILRKIADVEPVSPRRIASTIPRDLETIVLKAISKESVERYDTAAAMADDLRRLLADEPIGARPPGMVARTRKWARRNRPLVSTAAATLIVAATIGGVLLWHERQQTLAALQRVTEQQQLADQVVDKFYIQFADRARVQPGQTPVQREFLEAATHYYEGLASEREAEPEAQFAAALAQSRLANLYRELRVQDKAERAHQTSTAILKTLVRKAPDDRDAMTLLVDSTVDHGFTLLGSGANSDSAVLFREALAELGPALQATPQDPGYLQLRARANNHLGLALLRLGRFDEAESVIRQAITTQEMLVRDAPDDLDLRARIAFAHHDLAQVPTVDVAERKQLFQQSIRLLEELAAEHPYDPAWRFFLARPLFWYGCLLRTNGDADEAKQLFQRSFEIRLAIAASHPKMVSYQEELFDVAFDLALLYQAQGELQSALDLFTDAIDRSPAPLPMLAAWNAEVSRALGQGEEALVDLLTAIEQIEGMAAHSDVNSRTSRILDTAYGWSFNILVSCDRYREAADQNQKRLALLGPAILNNPGDQKRVSQYTTTVRETVSLLISTDRLKDAKACFDNVLPVLEQVAFTLSDEPRFAANVRANGLNSIAWLLVLRPEDGLHRAEKGVEFASQAVQLMPEPVFWNTLGLAHYRNGDTTKAVDALEKSAELLGAVRYPTNKFLLAMAYHGNGDHRQARQHYDTGINWVNHMTSLGRKQADFEQLLREEAATALGVPIATEELRSASPPSR